MNNIVNSIEYLRGEEKNKEKKKKFNFTEKRKNTVKSLKEVEKSLRNIDKIFNYVKLYKILK